MDLMRVGTALRAIREHRGLRLDDVAARSGVSRAVLSRMERGEGSATSIGTLDRIASALGAAVDVYVRWHGGDLQRLIAAEHSALHEAVAGLFGSLDGWVVAPEVSFSIYGERGVIDWLAWHPATKTLLVIELKTALVDVNELLGTLDRKRRLAARIAAERGWVTTSTSTWLIVSESTRNRRAVHQHRRLFSRVFHDDGHRARAWLRCPSGTLQALSFLPISRLGAAARRRQRVRAVEPPAPRTGAVGRVATNRPDGA